jgi:hypothetical protein
MTKRVLGMVALLSALGACGSDAGEILLACDYRAGIGECSEVIRGSGAGTFEGDCTNEVAECPQEGVVATCTEDEDFAYEIIYYYANADLVDGQEDCEFFDGIWEQL